MYNIVLSKGIFSFEKKMHLYKYMVKKFETLPDPSSDASLNKN